MKPIIQIIEHNIQRLIALLPLRWVQTLVFIVPFLLAVGLAAQQYHYQNIPIGHINEAVKSTQPSTPISLQMGSIVFYLSALVSLWLAIQAGKLATFAGGPKERSNGGFAFSYIEVFFETTPAVFLGLLAVGVFCLFYLGASFLFNLEQFEPNALLEVGAKGITFLCMGGCVLSGVAYLVGYGLSHPRRFLLGTVLLFVSVVWLGSALAKSPDPSAAMVPGFGAIWALVNLGQMDGPLLFGFLLSNVLCLGLLIHMICRLRFSGSRLFPEFIGIGEIFSAHPPKLTRPTVELACVAYGVIVILHHCFGWLSAHLPYGWLAIAMHLLFGLFAVRTVIRVQIPRKELFLEQTPSAGQCSAAILVALSFVVPALFLASFFAEESPRQVSELLHSSSLAYLIVALCLLPALVEEFVFRGIILGGFLAELSAMGSAFLSSALFGLLHGPSRLVPTFALGIVLAAITLRTGNLLLAIVCHFSYNLFVILLAKVVQPHLGGEFLMGLLFLSPITLGLSLSYLLNSEGKGKSSTAPSEGDSQKAA